MGLSVHKWCSDACVMGLTVDTWYNLAASWDTWWTSNTIAGIDEIGGGQIVQDKLLGIIFCSLEIVSSI